MYYSVKSVSVIEKFTLLLVFESGEKKTFDMKPYLENGIFSELKQGDNFYKIKISYDTISWENGADFDPEVLYEKGVTA